MANMFFEIMNATNFEGVSVRKVLVMNNKNDPTCNIETTCNTETFPLMFRMNVTDLKGVRVSLVL